MDTKFHAAIDAIKSHDHERFRELVRQDPTLATARSRTSHPTLLQCLVLEAANAPAHVAMVHTLIDAGAELNAPLVACASCDNVEAGAILLDHGAALNGTKGWSPLEEALYWNSPRVIALLRERGASIHNLRIAAGLGRTDLIPSFFNEDGSLRPEAGRINWPWGDVDAIADSNFSAAAQRQTIKRVLAWANDRQDVVNNAFIYACMHGHVDTAVVFLEKGAEINAIPGGFDYSGTALHYAALNGHLAMAEFLIRHGADPRIKDTKVRAFAAGWAEHGGHPAVARYLEGVSPAGIGS